MTTTRLKQAIVSLALMAGMCLAASVSRVQAGEDKDAELRAIIDKAIKAHGGAEKLSQFKATRVKWVGKRKVENMFYWDAVYVLTYEMPDKIRFDVEVENPNGSKFAFSRVVNGKKGWQGSVRGTRDLKEADVAQMVDEIYAHSLASMVPLTDKGFELDAFGSVTVDGKEAIGVRVLRKGRPDVNVFFDKKTGLAIKSEHRAKDPLTEEEYTAESIYRDHKPFHGVMFPTSRIDRRDGRDLEENSGRFALSDYQAFEKLEERSLSKP